MSLPPMLEKMKAETKKLAKEKANSLVITFGKHLALKCVKECYFFCHDSGSMMFLLEVDKQINLIKQPKYNK